MHKIKAGLPAPDSYEFLDQDDSKSFKARPAEIVSPLAEFIQTEHQHGGLFTLQEPIGPKKKRKRCGICGPCMRSENCGTCSNCLNRKVGHQICKLRKCEELKRRRNSWQVEYCEDTIKACAFSPSLVTETVSGVGSVDGPRGSGQMEIDHDRLEKGVLNQEQTNGVNQHTGNGNETDVNEGGALASEQHQQSHHHSETFACLPQTQGWGSGHYNGAPKPQQQQAGWNDQTTSSSVNNVDMEAARKLVDFSANADALATCNMSQPSQNPTAQLYEKFIQEMGGLMDDAKQKGWSGDGEHCVLDDLNTLQMALTQARNGQKPPNCDCDGPECPDYLEWLEKKIKMAATDQDKGPCKMSGAPPTQQQHYQSHPQPQSTDAKPSCGSESQSQDPVNQPMVARPYGPAAPIPCSPSVLSIAKERKVSLQTAIAIEALTQLGESVSESARGNSHHHASPQTPSQTQNGMRLLSSSPDTSSASPMPQSVPPGHFPQQDPSSWEQHRPQSQGSAPHSSQYSSSSFSSSQSSTASPFPQQWQQGTGASCEKSSPRNPWMMMNPGPHFPQPSHSGSDPMSELKQLLGDTSGKYANAAFKFPALPQNLKDSHKGGHSVMPYVKQEIDNGEYQACVTMGQFGMVNGQQQQFQGQQLPQSIKQSTQAALHQLLHHKRNLFSSSPPFSPRTPMTCQTLRKWWPQTVQDSALAIKQEPKKKKNAQSSPILKQPMGGLLGALAPPLPKPKQIVIKKHKQKASQPIFLPQNQITVQKSPPMSVSSISHLTPCIPGIEAGSPNCIPPYNPSQVAMSQAAPAHTQESILNSSSNPISGNTPAVFNPVSVPASPAQEGLTSSGLAMTGGPTTSTPQTPTSQPTPSLAGLSSLDPKFEELIRQFEEEFGDALPNAPLADGSEEGPAPSVVTESQQNSNSGQARPQSPSTEQLNTPLVDMSSQPESMQEGGNERQPDVDQAENMKGDVSNSQVPAIKKEVEECMEVKPSSQLLSQMQEAYLQQQHHRVLEDPFTMSCTTPTKRMKIESSGHVTVLSTTGCFSTPGDDLATPTKEGFPSGPSLKGFLESPLRYLDTPTKSLLDTPGKDSQAEFPLCDCVEQIIEKDEGPYYNHLGSGPTVASIRELMESRFGEKGDAIRIEKVVYTGREGKSSQGCPIAKWVIRRSSEREKLLCLVRHRAGHHCANAVIIILIMAWDGVPRSVGDKLYQEVSDTITKYGNPTSRRCGLNEDRTCACQGKDPEKNGASFSFGCSWSMYFNGCKYARSKNPRKFRLQGDHPKEEELLRDNFQDLATRVAPVYKKLAPKAYSNQCAHEDVATDCRLGLKEGRPFSGITACMDFCAHAHKDQHNLHNGCTVVCTLTKEDNRQIGVIPDDEQLHVLPLYKVSPVDEFGSEENQRLKIKTGAIQVLNSFRREVRKLPEPAKSCRQRRLEAKKAASEKKNKKQQLAETPEKMIKKEIQLAVSPHPQQGNKAIPKQEVKPTIKKELVGRFQAMNGDLDGYSALGNGKMCPDPYGMNGAYSFPGPYARGGLPCGAQPSAPSPVNGFHPKLQGMPYNYYNYPPNALLPPEVLGCEGRNGTWPKAEQKPDVQGLQARLAQAYFNRPDQQRQVAELANSGYLSQSELSQSPAPPNRAPSAPPEQHRVTPVIKQEPMEMSLYENRTEGQVRSCPTTPSVTPQPNAWPGHKPNGSLASKGWDGNLRPGLAHSPFTPDKQMLHQQHRAQPQHPQYAHPQQQWSYPGTPVASPAPSHSPALKAGPSPAPSPHNWDSPAPSPQPKSWGPIGSAGYGPGALRQGTPVGAFPDKMLSQAVESRGSTPLGLQEKAWKSGGASAAGSTPSPAPEGRLFPDALQKVDGQACWESEVESQGEPEHEEEVWSDSEHNFLDPNIGGVAVAPGHCSILIECARRELHATTPLKKPDRSHPTRISLVFYQHKNLNQPSHGLALWEAKMKLLAERARQRQQEAALLGLSQEEIKAYTKKRKWADSASSTSSGQTKDKREGVVTRMAPTQHTTTTATVSPYAFTQLTGPYSRFM